MRFLQLMIQVVDLMLKSVQPEHSVNSMLACKALSNLVAAGHPLSVEKVLKIDLNLNGLLSHWLYPSISSLNETFKQVVELLPALLPATSNNLETALASLLSNLSVELQNHHFPISTLCIIFFSNFKSV